LLLPLRFLQRRQSAFEFLGLNRAAVGLYDLRQVRGLSRRQLAQSDSISYRSKRPDHVRGAGHWWQSKAHWTIAARRNHSLDAQPQSDRIAGKRKVDGLLDEFHRLTVEKTLGDDRRPMPGP
jgi:hypothetical protein